MDSRIANRTEALVKAFRANNLPDLKRLANDSIREAVLENKKELAEIAVIAYSLYKILSKDHFTRNRHWPTVSESIILALKKAIASINKGEQNAFNRYISNVEREIGVIDSRLSNFARTIYEKSRVKQASTAYALGLSLNQAAFLTNADRKTLQNYIGATRIHDEEPIRMGIKQRLSKLKELLE